MLASTSNWPVFVSTALCSTAHSSGVSRPVLLQRAIQPGAGAFADGLSACGADVEAGCGAICAAFGAPLALGVCCA
jgi:hypothetical protein